MTDSAVRVNESEPGIVQITMEDRESKNTFSKALLEGLIGAFEKVENDERYKAVVLTGYDSYFASGGTKDGLLAIQEGKAKFTDGKRNVYSMALDCPIPVISAMQGHGIGGGFVMGLFADFVVLGKECVYTTNFMKYGFTPGMGATFILPRKLGIALSEEMLFGAESYRGAELERRGIPFPVVPRDRVLEKAYEFARSVAEKPRRSLVLLKNQLVGTLREQLPDMIRQEVAMHELTFHHSEVKDRIANLFGK